MKFKRQAKIVELIREYEIDTQDELADRLRENGFEVTQATISRDIKELMLAKTLTSSGSHRYVLTSTVDKNISERLIRVLRESVVGLDCAKNILVIKTLPGTASGVAAAIDSMDTAESVGTLAGNDVIFCAAKTDEKAYALMNKLKNYVLDRTQITE